MKPLTQAETDQLLILLRKLWKANETEGTFSSALPVDPQLARIAKSLFALITRKLYERE